MNHIYNRADDESIAAGKWTIETLRIDLLGRIDSMGELNTTKFDALQRQLTAGFEGSEKSVLNALVPVKTAMDKAELTNDKRFDALTPRFDALTQAQAASDRAVGEKLNALTQAVTAATASAAATAA